jgi:hypothetical protein
MSINLSDRTVLANLSVSRWGGHRFDKRATDEVHKNNDAAADTGNYNKRLLPRGASGKIDSVVSAARDYHRTHTLPWLDDGVRILPAVSYMEYAERMREYRQEFDKEVADFLKQYPTFQKEAKSRLGKLFNLADYPDPKKLAGMYQWQTTILPFPDAQDFRVQVPELDKIKKDVEARMNEVYESAMHDLGERITDVVGRMVERLKGYKPGKEGKRAEGTFKDSLVDNVRELSELLPSLNLGGDKKLTKIIARMQAELCKHDADLLRDDDKIRAKVATSADAILSDVAAFIA